MGEEKEEAGETSRAGAVARWLLLRVPQIVLASASFVWAFLSTWMLLKLVWILWGWDRNCSPVYGTEGHVPPEFPVVCVCVVVTAALVLLLMVVHAISHWGNRRPEVRGVEAGSWLEVCLGTAFLSLEMLLVVWMLLSKQTLVLDIGLFPVFFCLVLPLYLGCLILCLGSPASKTVLGFCKDQILLPVIPAVGILAFPWVAFKIVRYCVEHQAVLNMQDALGNLPLPVVFRIVLWSGIVLVAGLRLAGGIWCYKTWQGVSTEGKSVARRRVWRRVEICLDIAFLLVGLTVAANWLIPKDLENLGRGFCSIPFYFMLLVDAGWLIYCLSSYARKRIVAALGFVVLFVCGCALYLAVPVDDATESMKVYERQLAAPNRTIASFFPSRGGYESVSRPAARYCYFLFHSAVLFYIALLTFAFFGQSLVNILEHWFCWHRRLNVFWGRGDAGILLARSILRSTNDQQVFFCLPGSSIDGDDQKSVTADLDDMKASWIFSDRAESVTAEVAHDTLAHAKGFRHFFLEGNGHVNVSRADRLVQLLKTYNEQSNLLLLLWRAIVAGQVLWWGRSAWKTLRRLWAANKPQRLSGWKRRIEESLHLQAVKSKSLLAFLGMIIVVVAIVPVIVGLIVVGGVAAITHRETMKKLLKEWRDRINKGETDFRRQLMTNLEKPYFYVRIEAAADEQVYLQWAARVKDWVRPVIVRESQLIARDLSRKYPLLEMPGINIDHEKGFVKGHIKILLLGLGACGRDVLNELVCNGQYLSGEDGACVPFSVDVIEKDKAVCDDFQVECPDACEAYQISFFNMSVWEKAFGEWFGNYLDRSSKCPEEEAYSCIVICAGGDEENVSIASYLSDFARRHGTPLEGDGLVQGQAAETNRVFVKVSDPARARYSSEIPGFKTFGALDKVYSYAYIDTEQVDRSAMLFNYCRECREAERGKMQSSRDDDVVAAWEKLDFPLRLSRRAAAESMKNILGLLGYEFSVDKVKPKVTADEIAKCLDGEESPLMALAETEHLQWMAFMRMHGVRLWDVFAPRETFPRRLQAQIPVSATGEPLAEEKRIDSNQGREWGRHANLVPFRELPEVDRQIDEWNKGKKIKAVSPSPSQNLDIEFCRNMASIAEKMGGRIVKKESKRG